MIIGIDLGTTNSLVAIYQDNNVQVIPNSLGKVLTPSVISVDDDSILIGEPALNRLVTYPNLTISNFKRTMGSDKKYQLGNFTFRAEELSSLLLRRLKEDAEAYLGKEIVEAVISVPAYFSDAQRKATKIAGKLAGLHVERIINEPTAAGIAYGLQEQADETTYLIIDLGGGTLDVSILTMFSGIIEVRATSGDNYLGGIDFTKIIMNMFKSYAVQNDHLKTENISLELEQKIREQAELAKHLLSSKSSAMMSITHNSKNIKYEIGQENFEEHSESLLQKLRDPVKKVLNDAKLSPSAINKVILVGGASRMTSIKKLVTKMFGKLPYCHLDPDTVIVHGVAIQAALKEQQQALDEIVVTDVCPYSLGIAVFNSDSTRGILSFDPIIERNTVIPTSRSRMYFAVDNNQKYCRVQVYQGESFNLDKNIFLGDLKISLPPNLKDPSIEVRFTYDINGLLEVEATILETKEKHTLIIEGNPGILSEEEIKERLEALKQLKVHPRDQTENLLVLSQAERLFEDLTGDLRQYLADLIKQFIRTLDTQDPILITRNRKSLLNTMNDIQKDLN